MENIKNMQTQLYKTKLCRSVELGAPCKFGAYCHYAHHERELQPVMSSPPGGRGEVAASGPMLPPPIVMQPLYVVQQQQQQPQPIYMMQPMMTQQQPIQYPQMYPPMQPQYGQPQQGQPAPGQSPLKPNKVEGWSAPPRLSRAATARLRDRFDPALALSLRTISKSVVVALELVLEHGLQGVAAQNFVKLVDLHEAGWLDELEAALCRLDELPKGEDFDWSDFMDAVRHFHKHKPSPFNSLGESGVFSLRV